MIIDINGIASKKEEMIELNNNVDCREKEILKRLKTINGHMNAVVKMMENEKPYDEIIFQLEAIRSAISNTTSILAQCYVQLTMFESMQKGDKSLDLDSIKKPIEILMRVSEHSLKQSIQTLNTEVNLV